MALNPDGTTAPFDLGDWALGPGSILGGIGNWLDFSFGQPLSGQTLTSGIINIGNSPDAQQTIWHAFEQAGLVGNQAAQELVTQAIQQANRDHAAGKPPSIGLAEVMDLIRQEGQFQEGRTQADELETREEEGTAEALRLLGETKAGVQTNIDRFGNILSNPGALRADVEYGAALGEAENYLNASANRSRREVASATSQSGVAGSGRAAAAVQRAEDAAAFGKQGAYNTLFGQAQTNKTDLERYMDSLNAAEGDIALGGLGRAQSLAGFRQAAAGAPFFSDLLTGPALGLEVGRRGLSADSRGEIFGFGSAALSGFQDAASDVSNLLFNR